MLQAPPGSQRLFSSLVSADCPCPFCPPQLSLPYEGIIPAAHLADGLMYLVMVRRCNHAQYLRFLLTLSHCGLSDCCLPFVRVIPVTAGKPHLVNSVFLCWEHILEHSVSMAWGLGLRVVPAQAARACST